VAVFLVASGLCGLQWLVAMGGSGGGGLGGVLIPLGVVELIAMLLSGLGIVVMLILLVVRSVYVRFAKPQEEVQKLFDDGEDLKQ